MKKLLTAFLVSALLIISGCSSNSNTANTTTAPNTETNELMTTYTYNIGGEPTYLDPARNGDSVTSEVTNQIWYPLFIIGDDGSTVNADCVSYEVSDDGLVYTLHLDENAKWSDGVALTADQYVYSIKRSIGMGHADVGYLTFITNYVKNAAAHAEALDDVADMDDVGVRAVDDYTLEITLETACPFFVQLLPNGVFTALREEFAPEHDSEWSNTVGYPTTGAFVPTKIDSTSEYIMTKNEYFSHADEVVLETLIAKIMPDMDASLMAFQTGEIDYATSVNSDVIKVYEGQPELVISGSVVNYYVNINSYTSVDALKDKNVRRALQLGIDRSAIVEALDAEEVYYELHGFVPVGLPGENGDFRTEADENEQLVYTDKEEAKKLMEEAGYSESNPLELTYYYNQNTMHDLVAEVLKAQLADIYVNLTLKTGELRTFFNDRSDGLFDLARNAFSADYMDPFNYLELAATYNKSIITQGDATYDALLNESQTMSGQERMAKLHEAETYLVKDMSYNIPLFGYKTICLAKAGTTGVISNPQGNHIFWYVSCPAN